MNLTLAAAAQCQDEWCTMLKNNLWEKTRNYPHASQIKFEREKIQGPFFVCVWERVVIGISDLDVTSAREKSEVHIAQEGQKELSLLIVFITPHGHRPHLSHLVYAPMISRLFIQPQVKVDATELSNLLKRAGFLLGDKKREQKQHTIFFPWTRKICQNNIRRSKHFVPRQYYSANLLQHPPISRSLGVRQWSASEIPINQLNWSMSIVRSWKFDVSLLLFPHSQ